MGRLTQPANIWTTINEILRRLRDLETTPRVQYAAIGKGGLQVNGGSIDINGGGGIHVDGGDVVVSNSGTISVEDGSIEAVVISDPTTLGVKVVFFGAVPEAPYGDTQFVLNREDGTNALMLFNGGQGAGSPQFISLWDRAGNIIVSDDTNSGTGLARPYVPYTVMSSNTAREETTNSATFADLWEISGNWQHPMSSVQILARASDASTAGQFRVVDGYTSAVLSTTVTLAAGGYSYLVFPDFATPGAFSDDVILRVQGRRTAGTGTVGCRVNEAYGKQT